MQEDNSFFSLKLNLAKLDCGLNQSPTVMVGEKINRGIPNPSWVFIKNKSFRFRRDMLGGSPGGLFGIDLATLHSCSSSC